MANPEVEERLDGFDKATVILYRSSLSLIALILAFFGTLFVIFYLSNTLDLLKYRVLYIPFLGLGLAGAVSSLHLYDKRLRWFISFCAWLGLSLSFMVKTFSADLIFECAALGFSYVSLSALALKERFCFKITGLPLIPLLLIATLVARLTQQSLIEGGLLLIGAGIFTSLTIAKWRMPLHFDVGDKSRYQN